MKVETLAEEWARILAGTNPVRRQVYYEALRQALTNRNVHIPSLAEDIYHNKRHSTVRLVRRYVKELVDKNILQKRRLGFGGQWYYDITDWWRALLIETYKALK
jgi:hypothetical protein